MELDKPYHVKMVRLVRQREVVMGAGRVVLVGVPVVLLVVTFVLAAVPLPLRVSQTILGDEMAEAVDAVVEEVVDS